MPGEIKENKGEKWSFTASVWDEKSSEVWSWTYDVKGINSNECKCLFDDKKKEEIIS